MSETGHQLKAYVERIERIDDQRDQFSDDKRVVYAEAKFDHDLERTADPRPTVDAIPLRMII